MSPRQLDWVLMSAGLGIDGKSASMFISRLTGFGGKGAHQALIELKMRFAAPRPGFAELAG
jgi:hypothetical protein